MTSFQYPGVYMQEGSSGVRPISGASTSTAAFIGAAERGPVDGVRLITNVTEFQRVYGGFLPDTRLAHSVLAYFANGGSQCYVVRVVRAAGAQPDEVAVTASITLSDATPRSDAAGPQDAVTISASSPGPWGNDLQVRIDLTNTPDPANTFDLVVYRTAGGPPQEVERFSGLSMDPSSPSDVETVTARSEYVRVSRNGENSNAGAGSVEGSPPADGGLGAQQRRLRIGMHGDDLHEIELDLSAGEQGDLGAIAGKLQAAIRGVKRGPAAPADAYRLATVENRAGRLRITSGAKGAGSSVRVGPAADPATNAAGALGFDHGVTTVGGAAALRPRATPPKTYDMLGDDERDAPDRLPGITGVVEGRSGGTPGDQDYIAALPLLDTVRDVSVIAVPGIGAEAVAAAGMTYCRNRPLSDCFFVADMAEDDDTPDEADAWRTNAAVVPNSYGAVYFPWLLTSDPAGGRAPVAVPPSGFVAGLYARTDTTRGVWKTPAGVQAGVAGALGLVREVTDVEQGRLNDHRASVSVIRRFPGAGIVLWGGRTLSQDSEWRYIAVRRTAIFLRVSIAGGIQWAVFEPNDEPLWAQLRLNITAFMTTLFRRGAFAGSTPDQAFFVKVDSETTTQADVDNGVVNVRVGFAPLKPAEFVVVTISQTAGRSG